MKHPIISRLVRDSDYNGDVTTLGCGRVLNGLINFGHITTFHAKNTNSCPNRSIKKLPTKELEGA